MYLTELYDTMPQGYYSEKDDNSVKKLKDFKSRLTLAHLNKIRMANDLRKLEKEEEVKRVTDQYKPPAPEAGAVPGM